MSFDIPSEESFYEDVIKKRIEYNKYMDDNFTSIINDIIEEINTYIIRYSLYNKSILWVGGGRAWGECLNLYFSDKINKISTIEKVSITSGNFDLFLLSNNKQSHEHVIEYIIHIVEKIFNDKKQYKIIYGNMNPVNYPNDMENCTLFPCQSIIIELKKDNYKKKMIFYLESFLVDPSIKIKSFYSILFNTKKITYLNPTGLLLFSSFISQKRTEKSINVDYYRTKLLNKLLPTPINNSVLNSYLNIFYNTEQYSKYIKNTLVKNIIFTTIDINEYESSFIEKIRPYVNSFIYELTKTLENYQCKFFLVGGDAIRRYLSEITTKDFDYKIYIKKKDKKTKKLIIDKLIEKLSIFVYYINQIIIDSEVYNVESSDFIINYCYTPDSLYKKQYRLRYIEKNKNFDIDLFSIDYITKLCGMYYSNPYTVTHNISLIDISIVEIDSFDNVEFNTNLSKIVNIPSLNFLLNDIKRMYNTQPENRYWDKKNIKDLYRFHELSKKTDITMDIDDNANIYLDTTSDIQFDENVNTKEYIDTFEFKIKNDTTYKHKMDFDAMNFLI